MKSRDEREQTNQAWLKVKANKGVAGVDDQSIADFEVNLSGNYSTIFNYHLPGEEKHPGNLPDSSVRPGG
ncbi:hypothetical protein [Salinisphaera sp. G21_0]|uniref:hypothetical protein n=1 Tax=Salinisphaera sp. G21_0 TaxID=2821094 RepID=UPI001ADB71DF|nr:hypothetical protein [Salinisphaera sp. G21_0]MBO9483392.1 hypothetical protein [Salinisphaera sp. G21_0]